MPNDAKHVELLASDARGNAIEAVIEAPGTEPSTVDPVPVVEQRPRVTMAASTSANLNENRQGVLLAESSTMTAQWLRRTRSGIAAVKSATGLDSIGGTPNHYGEWSSRIGALRTVGDVAEFGTPSACSPDAPLAFVHAVATVT